MLVIPLGGEMVAEEVGGASPPRANGESSTAASGECLRVHLAARVGRPLL
jgi:hypothetical protein